MLPEFIACIKCNARHHSLVFEKTPQPVPLLTKGFLSQEPPVLPESDELSTPKPQVAEYQKAQVHQDQDQ